MSKSGRETANVAELLNQWFRQIEQDEMEGGRKIQSRVKKMLDAVEDDADAKRYYALLDRHHQDRLHGKKGAGEVHPLLTYYFHLHRGLHAFNLNAYEEALTCFRQAEQYLDFVKDEVEKAEFYYKFSGLNYHMCLTDLSLEMARKALAIFEPRKDYEMRTAACYVIIALNYINLKKFSQAEDLFALAWASAVYSGDAMAQGMVCHNLGLLYKKKQEPATSIKWLLESMKYVEPVPSTYYLLAEAAFNLCQKGNARNWIENGMALSQSTGNAEYWHRFKILKARLDNEPPEKLEPILKEGLAFFEQEGLWLSIKDDVRYLIDLYEKMGQEKKAEAYRQLERRAIEKLKVTGMTNL